MLTSDIEEQIIEYLKNNSDEFHPSQVKPIVYAVYGGEKINTKNISSLVREIYSILCKLEKEGVVKMSFTCHRHYHKQWQHPDGTL